VIQSLVTNTGFISQASTFQGMVWGSACKDWAAQWDGSPLAHPLETSFQ
jgi:hypothetical protein